MASVEWGKYRIDDLFKIQTSAKRFDANKVNIIENGRYPYVVRTSSNNGQKGFLDENESFLNAENTISFGQDTATIFYQEKPYFTGDKIKVLVPKVYKFNKKNAQFFLASMNIAFSKFSWGSSRFNVDVLKEQVIMLPTKCDSIDFEFMESFIEELEAERIKELEAHLTVTGLKDYILTEEEHSVLDSYEDWEWNTFNLEDLFGKSTRGKRLKSADRIPGELPFVTAGEADEGISDFIGNDVAIFSENTTTIDMFGSAKYRNYKYGGDDHVAVVHTETLPKLASIFVTSAIHKSSHSGQFDYSKNFYAKDADALNIQLPSRGGQPDYECMATFISAVQKIVIKDVVLFADRKIGMAKEIVNK